MAKWTIKMTEKQKLRVEERAEKIAKRFSGRDFKTIDEGRLRELLKDYIAAAILEAEKEAREECVRLQQEINCLRMEPCQLPGCKNAFRAGQIAMREEAGQMVEMLLFQSLQQNEEAEKWLSNRIRALPISESETLKNEVNNSEVNE